MIKVKQKMPTLDAIRYGNLENGEWYTNAVQDIAQFLKQVPFPEGSNKEFLVDIVQPVGVWNPPDVAELYLMNMGTSRPVIINPGDWIVRRETGGIDLYTDQRFHNTFEFVEEEDV